MIFRVAIHPNSTLPNRLRLLRCRLRMGRGFHLLALTRSFSFASLGLEECVGS